MPIKYISNIYVDGKFGLFAQILIVQCICRDHQIRHFVQKSITCFPDFLTNTIDHIPLLSPYCKYLIYTLYNNICNIIPHSLQDVRRLWQNNTGKKMTDDQREAVLDLVHTSSPCARDSLIQLKIVLRAHLTKARLVKIFPNVDSCPCPLMPLLLRLINWANIFSAYTKMFQKDITPNPICALFGFTPETCSLKGNAYVVIIAFTSLIA